jgi:hypothetical protein
MCCEISATEAFGDRATVAVDNCGVGAFVVEGVIVDGEVVDAGDAAAAEDTGRRFGAMFSFIFCLWALF